MRVRIAKSYALKKKRETLAALYSLPSSNMGDNPKRKREREEEERKERT